ncbi:MAG: 5 nucleotidase, deoxy (Pyrimidine), cytosolic type protein [Bacteroidota bacterium]|jgi:uncharacterized HAD superfamily protein
MTKFISVDIDGILNNYPICWLEFIKIQTAKSFTSTIEAKLNLGDDVYKEIKHLYRTSGYKSKLPVQPFAALATKIIESKGYSIVITTSRPFDKYDGLEELTKQWLINNSITFHHLHKKQADLLDKFPSIIAHIDDEFDHTLIFLEKNITVFLTSDLSVVQNSKFNQSPLIKQVNNILQFAEELPKND